MKKKIIIVFVEISVTTLTSKTIFNCLVIFFGWFFQIMHNQFYLKHNMSQYYKILIAVKVFKSKLK